MELLIKRTLMKCSFFYKKEKVECITYKFSYAIWTNNRCVYKSKWKKPFISIKNKTKKTKTNFFPLIQTELIS